MSDESRFPLADLPSLGRDQLVIALRELQHGLADAAANEIEVWREEAKFARAVGKVWLDLTLRGSEAVTDGEMERAESILELRRRLAAQYPEHVAAENAKWGKQTVA